MKTGATDRTAAVTRRRSAAIAEVIGLDQAIEFARSGRLISAIKHIEVSNPKLSRKKAMEIVHSLGYGREVRWPEKDRAPGRCL